MSTDRTYDRKNLPKTGWVEYRKKGTTRMMPVRGPFQVKTKEGLYCLPPDWEGFIALDKDGDPYPIALDVWAHSYERVDVVER